MAAIIFYAPHVIEIERFGLLPVLIKIKERGKKRAQDKNTQASSSSDLSTVILLLRRLGNLLRRFTYVAELKVFQVMSLGQWECPWCIPTELTCSS